MVLAHHCDICGAKMRRFRNEDGSDRWLCPKVTTHSAILEQQRRGGKRKGAGRKKK